MQSDSTCWSVIRGAAEGNAIDREEFARRYGPVVRAYLAASSRTVPHCVGFDLSNGVIATIRY